MAARFALRSSRSAAARGRHACVAVCLALVAAGGTGCAGGDLPAAAGEDAGLPPDLALRLAAADALVYANRYSQAEVAFASLEVANPLSGGVHADHALFLAYRRDFGRARVEAERALAVDPLLARAYAVLCRVEEWAGHLPAALAAGRSAVQLDAADSLAHLFYAEALADAGDLRTSRDELVAARSAIGAGSPAYLRAELYRAGGELGRASGDVRGELMGFTAAFQAQPGWAERPAELAQAYLDGGDLVGAHNALDKALGLTPDDPTLLAELGRVAMLEPDYPAADAAFMQLVRLQPRSSTVLELAAHARFAHTGDLDAAVALLERAITADPGNLEAVAYLVYLERDVRDDAARGLLEVDEALAAARDDPGPVAHRHLFADFAAAQEARAEEAMAAINGMRVSAGLAPVALDSALSVAALTHCYYWLFNNSSAAVAGLGIHAEAPGTPGFSGVRPSDRDVNFGWHGGPVGEDVTHTGDPVAATRVWADSVYHRFPIMSPELSAIGYGDCAAGPVRMEDMEFGFGIVETAAHAPVVFPADGQQQVPDSFSDNEVPDPLPAGKPRLAGYPVTVTFDPAAGVTVEAFTLTGSDGKAVPAYRLDPDPQAGNTATLIPVAPLQAHARYAVHIAAGVDGANYDRTWSFATA